jgi:hypothetical protein
MAQPKKEKVAKKGSERSAFPMQLRGNQRLLWRAVMAEYKSSVIQLDAARRIYEAELAKPEYNQLRKLIRDKEAAQIDLADKKRAFAEIQKQVATRFNIPIEKISEYSIDDRTGVVYPP